MIGIAHRPTPRRSAAASTAMIAALLLLVAAPSGVLSFPPPPPPKPMTTTTSTARRPRGGAPGAVVVDGDALRRRGGTAPTKTTTPPPLVRPLRSSAASSNEGDAAATSSSSAQQRQQQQQQEPPPPPLPIIPNSPIDVTPAPPRHPSPLSLTVDELGELLGGFGRAQSAWDCLREGIDPLLYYDDAIDESTLDASVAECVRGLIPPSTRGGLMECLPPRRRTQGMGRGALRVLGKVMEGATSSSSSSEAERTRKKESTIGIEGGIATLSHIRTSRDGTTKLLVKLASDGLEVETVIIPWDERGSSTLCISSQVGCRQGCTFCATGRMGRLRSLTSDEILSQVYFARKVCRTLSVLPIDGVVFMGMGEPADNSDAVVKAAEILTERMGFGLARQRVTISTVAPNPDAFRRLGRAPAALAWSVHASRDELRKKLVPTTKYAMEELAKGYVDAMLSRPKKLRTSMLEVALIERVNDDPEEADHLADFALGMMERVPDMKLMVNLIPFNDIGHATYRKPSMERVYAFQERLTSKGVFCFIRTTRGDDESAACGQLATKKNKKQVAVST
uniref:Radical SAM core domain-containing protein n=1 Tax=Odontella aurita TaxID=265563 RepID=A0A7S4N2E0_9STRA